MVADTELLAVRPVVRRPRWRRLRGLLQASPPVAIIALFIGFPVITAILYTLGYGGGPNSVMALIAQDQHLGFPTLAAYQEVLGDHGYRGDLYATIIVTALSVALVLGISWGIGLYIRLSRGFVAHALSTLSVIPLFIPVVIASYAIRFFYAPDGFLRSVAELFGWHGFPTATYTIAGVTIGEVWTQLPFGVLMMISGLQAVPNSLIEAARDAGASLPRIIRSVLLPMNLVPTVIVGTFSAIYVLGSFTVPYLIGPNAPNLLGVSMTFLFQSYGRPQQSEVLAVIVFLLAAGIGATYVWANVRANKSSGVVQ